MSDPLRIAAVVEGPTDTVALRAILDAMLGGIDFELSTLQPDSSAALGGPTHGTTGQGWVGIYRWCRQSREEGDGSVSGSSVLAHHDLLIVHIDADVATKTYASGSIDDAARNDLPCAKPCPPPSDTTDALRGVVLGWLGEMAIPPGVVVCTPSMTMDAWVVAAIRPRNSLVRRSDWECRPNPDAQLGTLPRNQRFHKTRSDYERKRQEISKGWPQVASRLTEAERFQRELRTAVADWL